MLPSGIGRLYRGGHINLTIGYVPVEQWLQERGIKFEDRPKIDNMLCPKCDNAIPVPFLLYDDQGEQFPCPICNTVLQVGVDDFGDGDDYFTLEARE